MPWKARAFTFLELIAVIGILLLMAAILIPVLPRVKAAAKASVCISNLKQISLAYIMYGSDYDDSVPLGGYADPSPPPGALFSQIETFYSNWITSVTPTVTGSYDYSHGIIYPYVKSPPLHDCPVGATTVPNLDGYNPLSYAVNATITTNCDYMLGPCTTYNGSPLNTSRVEEPSATILMADTAMIYFNFDEPDIDGAIPTTLVRSNGILLYGTLNQTMHGIHSGKANVSWMDGHTQSASLGYQASEQYEALLPSDYPTGTARKYQLGDLLKEPCPTTTPSGSVTGCTGGEQARGPAYYYLISKSGN